MKPLPSPYSALVSNNSVLLLTLPTLYKLEYCEPANFKEVGSHPSRGGNVAKAFIKIISGDITYLGVWGEAPIDFPEGEKPTPPGSGGRNRARRRLIVKFKYNYMGMI